MKDLMGSRATVVLPFLMLPAALAASSNRLSPDSSAIVIHSLGVVFVAVLG